MAKLLTYEEMGKKIAEKALDGYIYKGKTLREWIDILAQTQWIPVSEGLPKEYGEYLITWITSQSKRPFIGISEGEVTGEYDHKHNRFKFEWLLEDYIKAYPNVEVIAWMPLPEPYKAESEE